MILYHGSNVKVIDPKIIASEKGKDFGFAFYLTPIKEQAERMAKRKLRQNNTGSAIVSVFEWDEDKTNLNCKKFKSTDLDWLEMIIKCRTDVKYNHGFDIVEGRIADDSVGETILYVIDKIMTPEAALERLKYQKINSQLAFYSERSLTHLKFIESYEIK